MGYSVDQVFPSLVFSHLSILDMLMFYLPDSEGAQWGIELQVQKEFLG